MSGDIHILDHFFQEERRQRLGDLFHIHEMDVKTAR